MTTPISDDIHLTLAVWVPDFDPIIAYELSRSGILPEGWAKDTCSMAAGVGTRFVHSLNRNGAICRVRKPVDGVEHWLARWEARFDEAWHAKASEVSLPEWKAVFVFGGEDRSQSSVARHSLLSGAVDRGLFDDLPGRINRLDWTALNEQIQLSEA